MKTREEFIMHYAVDLLKEIMRLNPLWASRLQRDLAIMQATELYYDIFLKGQKPSDTTNRV